MPRRRMIDPSFWDDEYVGKLTDAERIFIVGCLGNADDEGRLKASPSYIKAAIWMYDKDKNDDYCAELKQQLLAKMELWPPTHTYRMIQYGNGNVDYFFFPMWNETNRPSHPTKSKLPPPPLEMLPIFSGMSPDHVENISRDPPSQSRSGQSSLGKVSIGQVSGVPEDFTKLNDEKDLTDYLTTTLESAAARGPLCQTDILKQFWEQRTHDKIPGTVFQLTAAAVKQHSAAVMAKAYVKAVHYTPGKTSPVNYLKAILEEKEEKAEGKAKSETR